MASFAPIRGTRAQIATTPIVDGQFLVETNQGVNNRIYLDTGSTRSVVGGGTGLLPHLTMEFVDESPYGYTLENITVINPDGTSTTPTTQISTNVYECNVNSYGVYIINFYYNDGQYTTVVSKAVTINDAGEYNITYIYTAVSGGSRWIIDGGTDDWSEVIIQNNGTMTFTNLDPYLGYKIYFVSGDNQISDIPIIKYTNINKTISNGIMTLTYTIANGIDGSTQGILRIIR
jgi:hypothetical protein